jgi:hypothetical protein
MNRKGLLVAPDFVINQGMVEIGHLEAKRYRNFSKKLKNTPQIKRYLQALGNLIITESFRISLVCIGRIASISVRGNS